MIQRFVYSIAKAFTLFLCVTAFTTPAVAATQKFVYAYNSKAELLTPKNAADHCPDPAGDHRAASVCQGVLVDENGEYTLRFANGKVDQNNLVLVANEYEYIPATAPGVSEDTYVLLDGKRRVDKIKDGERSEGADINNLSEACVRAVESENGLVTGKNGHVDTVLADLANQVDAEKLNRALANDKADNQHTNVDDQQERDRRAVREQRLSDAEQETLADLAKVAIEHQADDDTQSYVRKSVMQFLYEPALRVEVAERVFSHVAASTNGATDAARILLEADKYRVAVNEIANLTTVNSRNSSAFFAYTWDGVDSINASAEFARHKDGSYLVCVSGEISNANDSSTDCIRLLVKGAVEAVARSSSLRIGTNNTLRLNASLSVGASQYLWSGSGVFANATSMATTWTAPTAPGFYTIDLVVNNGEARDSLTVEVYDVIPVAVAEARPEIVYLESNAAQVNLYSGSISTDGTAVDSLLWAIASQPPGAQAQIGLPTSDSAVFTTNTAGNYSIQLTATKRGVSDTVQVTVQVRRSDVPVADAGPDLVAYRNQWTNLNGSHSYAPQGRSLSYGWQATGGQISNATQAIAGFRTDTQGDYQVDLTVNDGTTTATDSTNVHVVNRAPAASDIVVANLLNEVLQDKVLAIDPDGDPLTYSLLTQPISGGVTLDPLTGEYTYVPGGAKGCQYTPSHKPTDNGNGGKDVPVIKLCADRYVIAPGETVNLTASNSINASKFSGYEWLNGAVGDSNDIRLATYVGTTEGLQQVCVRGNIGQSNNTSTACVEVLVKAGGGLVDDDPTTGYEERFTYKVTDGENESHEAVVIITIGWQNSAPVVEDLAIETLEDHTVSGSMTGTDADGHSLTYRIMGQGTIGTAVITNASSGAFTYTPTANANGVDSVTVVANDGYEDSATATVTVTVTSTNDYPVAYNSTPMLTNEDTAVLGVMGAMDPDGDVINFKLATLPSKGSVVILNSLTGAFRYTPDLDKNGEDSFYFVAYDSQYESNTAKVSLTITPVNDAPTAQGQSSLSVRADEILTGKLVGNDVDGDPLHYQLNVQPSKGVVTVDPGTGDFSYDPQNNQLGSDSFSFTVSDGLLTSSAASVSLTITPANLAPVAVSQNIVAMEGVPYGGALNGSDPEGQPITYHIEQQGVLGQAEIPDVHAGGFVYTPSNAGEDNMSFTVNDGDKTSTPANLTAQIIANWKLCAGPGNQRADQDQDGYADFVEQAFNTQSNNALSPASVPSAQQSGVSFADDDDGDNYSDVAELWLLTNFKDANSKPSQSTSHGVPTCLTALYDSQPPVIKALRIATPIVNMDNSETKASFVISALDNAVGVKSVEIVLTSAHGQINKAALTTTDSPLAVHQPIMTAAFNTHAEAGLWSITELKIRDARGNELKLDTALLQANGYPTQLTLVNANSDILAPSLIDFNITTPTVDVSGGTAQAGFSIQASDDVSGIVRVEVKVASPSGKQYRWAELTPAQVLNLNDTLTSNTFDAYSETGVWTVTALSLKDAAGNQAQYSYSDLGGLGLPREFDVVGPPAPTLPVLGDLQTLTPEVDVIKGDGRACFNVQLSAEAGVREIQLELLGPTGATRVLSWTIASAETSLDGKFCSDPFPVTAQPGPCTYQRFSVIDRAGQQSDYNAAQLTGLGNATEFEILNTVYPHSIQAYNANAATDEDVVLHGQLKAVDLVASHTLNYVLVSPPSKGSVSIDASTGAFTFTPKQDVYTTTTPDSFFFKVDDGLVESNVAEVKITINPVADPLVAQDLEFNVVENLLLTGALKATDPDKGVLTFTIVANGQSGNVGLSNASAGAFAYSPGVGFNGADSFTYKVTAADGRVSNTATVTVNVQPECVLKGFDILTNPVSGANLYATIASKVTLSCSPPLSSQAKITIVGPSGQQITLNASTSAVSPTFTISNNIYTPIQPLEVGSWTFGTLMLKKVGATTYKLVQEDLAAAGFSNQFDVLGNSAPTCSRTLSYGLTLDEMLTQPVSCADLQNDSLTYRIVTSPAKGVLNLSNANSGIFTYEPREIGVFSFEFVANDGHADSNRGLVTITVASIPLPKAFDGSLNALSSKVATGQLEAVDPQGDALTYSVVGQPSKGRVLVNSSTGSFTYYPAADYTGVDSFSFQVFDGHDYSNDASITVTVALGNQRPVITGPAQIIVRKNYAVSGQILAKDPEGQPLTYELVNNAGSQGNVILNSQSGAFTFTPALDKLGGGEFVVRVSDGKLYSDNYAVHLNIRADVCGAGGIVPRADSDGDGYVDVLEVAAGSDPQSALSTPADLNDQQLLAAFNNDDDSDGVNDYVEVWLGSDHKDGNSVPSLVWPDCFSASSDGIKPRLLGFHVATPSLDFSNGATVAHLHMTLMDNASGIKRARVSLRSPSGTFLTKTVSYAAQPLLLGVAVDFDNFTAYSEAGVWQVSSVTLYDHAGNRLDLTGDELSGAGFSTTIEITNSHSDTTAPVLDGLSILTPNVLPSGVDNIMSMQLTVTDSGSGFSSARVDLISVSGTIVTAAYTASSNVAGQVQFQLDTDVLSPHLEQGLWQIYSVLLTDVAGNSAQVVEQLTALGADTELQVTNPNSDSNAPVLQSFMILNSPINVSNGDARMHFSVAATDDVAGVAKVRVDICGPSGQVLDAWAEYSSAYPLSANIQIDSAILDSMTEYGVWLVESVEVFDEAGNSRLYDASELTSMGFELSMQVFGN